MDLSNLFGNVLSGSVSAVNRLSNGISNIAGNAINGIVGAPPIRGSINNFKASFSKDVARASRFDVTIPVPLGMILYLNTAKSLNYRCEGASLPGRTLQTLEQKTYGPIEKYPYLTSYTDIDLTFIVDDDMKQKVFFDAWLNYINPQNSNNFRYKEDYSTGITINQYDVTNQLSYSVTLYQAYPISMNQMDLDWSSDGFHKIVVTFAFTSWQNNTLQAAGMNLLEQVFNE